MESENIDSSKRDFLKGAGAAGAMAAMRGAGNVLAVAGAIEIAGMAFHVDEAEAAEGIGDNKEAQKQALEMLKTFFQLDALKARLNAVGNGPAGGKDSVEFQADTVKTALEKFPALKPLGITGMVVLMEKNAQKEVFVTLKMDKKGGGSASVRIRAKGSKE